MELVTDVANDEDVGPDSLRSVPCLLTPISAFLTILSIRPISSASIISLSRLSNL